MDTEKHNYTLEEIPANRMLVEKLYTHGKISIKAREYALNLLYPHNQWGMWVSNLLLTIGAALILSGIIYFFAFNWDKITPAIKLSSIQIGIVISIIGACLYSLRGKSGQILLLSASVLVGVFLAVFGQIYHTGADSFQLFMMWSLLTLGWTLISNFAPQWILWMIITNCFLILWWEQAAFPTTEMESMIFTYLALFNGTILTLREYFSTKKIFKWLTTQWTRVLLVITTLLILLPPIIALLLEPSKATESIKLGSVVGFIGLITAYLIYRYKLPDLKSLAITILSFFIIIENAIAELSFEEKLVKAAIERTNYNIIYDGSYYKIKYPDGDVPKHIGVCSDVIIRSYRALGIDLQRLVHKDMKKHFDLYPKLWDLKHPDPNIDHRRVPNLQIFFTRFGKKLPITNIPNSYKPGDIVTWNLSNNGSLPHIGIVTNIKSEFKTPLIVHNIGQGPKLEDMLFKYKITGHYKYPKT